MRTRRIIIAGLAVGGGLSGLPARAADLPHLERAGGQPSELLAADVTGMESITLAATGFSYGQAVWGEAILIDAAGVTNRLCDLTPVSHRVGWDVFRVNQGMSGGPLATVDRTFTHGLFAHADSMVVYRLGGRYVRFESRVGISATAGHRGRVVFELLDADAIARRETVTRLRQGFTRECLASLGRALDRAHSGPAAPRARELRPRLDALGKDFDALRATLDAGSAFDARLLDVPALVRDIRFLALDAPMLFVRRNPYYSPHIYDDYLTFHPGGGLYVLENPAAPPESQMVRPVIDPSTRETLGGGVYRDPDLSFDARRLLFAHKGRADGDTSIYEIGLDGRGLRRLSCPDHECPCPEPPAGLFGRGHHDIAPCWLPDGRIAFLSTRTAGLVMCFNNFIATLHTMNGDGTGLRPISVNNVSEFDPCLLPDGRILYGRWEYVDKTALYMQSLWTVNPDGTQETALFKNNLAKPTAVLDARPVPGSELIAAALTPHNGQSVGAIATIDPRRGKNTLAAIVNFTPEYPTEMDQGLRDGPCDPWPLDEDAMLIADNARSHGPHGVIQLIDRFGFRFTIRQEPDISCYSPILVRAQPAPPVRPSQLQDGAPARFFVHNLYEGMPGVKTGEVARLRVIETTSRVSGVPPGGRWWNQAFLVSWQGSYDHKRVLGTVPVEPDGSAWFEAPPGRALYVQALDRDGRLVQSMRTFVQAAPGTTRSCRGCHVPDDQTAPTHGLPRALALARPPVHLAPESWGEGLIDYPAMVQPVLDRHCVQCHGGPGGIAGGLDLTGGWTWAFSLSYETFLKNTLTGFLNCNNGSVRTAEILPPRTHGSGAAPLATVLVSGHAGRLAAMPRSDKDLLLAWMDGNCNYHGNGDYTPHAVNPAILTVREPLLAEMDRAGCVRCHAREIGSDWVNLQTPELSRMLRAPLAKAAGGGHGLAWCREAPARKPRYPLVTQEHQPPDVFRPVREPAPVPTETPATVFESATNASYQAMLAVIGTGRDEALKRPRADMPGAEPLLVRGRFREPLPLMAPPPPAVAAAAPVRKAWWRFW